MILLLFISFCFVNLLTAQPWSATISSQFFPASNLECSNEPWKLVFYDEFDGSSINTNKWYTFSPDGGPGCNGTDNCLWARTRDLQQVFSDDNLEVNNGMLTIYAKKEDITFMDELFHYTGGFIGVKPQFKTQYGRFEARIKLTDGDGLRCTFWSIEAGFEIDFVEYLGNRKRRFLTDVHHDGNHNGFHVKNQPSWLIDYSNAFHIYAVEWSPHKIEWFVDGISVRTLYRYQIVTFNPDRFSNIDCNNTPESGDLIRENLLFDDDPQSVILNLAVEGNVAGNSDVDDSKLPRSMKVNYIRIYQKNIQSNYYDFCGGTFDGVEDLCFGATETYTFQGDYSNVSFSKSSNLNIVNTTPNSVTISPTNTGFSTGWVKATVNFAHAPCSTKTYTKTLYAGQLISGTVNQTNPIYLSQPLQTVNFITAPSGNSYTTFNVDLDNTTVNYNWQITSGNGTIGGSNWNPQLITIPPNSTSLSCNISTTTGCGVISRTVAFVKTSNWYKVGLNPTNGLLNIIAIDDFEVQHSNDNDEIVYTTIKPTFTKSTLYNFETGEQVYSQESIEPIKFMTMDIAHIPKGKYILQIKNEEITSTHQIIIER